VLNVGLSKKKYVFIGLVIGILIVCFFAIFRMNSSSHAPVPVVFTQGDERYEKVSLTFNISWGDEKVHDILSVLTEHDVTATFFLSGEWAEKHPDIVEKIADNKHEIGMLGYRYKSYVEQEIEDVRQDLYLAQETFQKLNYDDITLLRAPSGHLNEEVVEIAKNIGFTVVHWNVNPNDWENPGTEEIVQQTIENTSNGDIILLHASDVAKQTATALNIIIPELKKKGLHLVTISELMNQAEVEAELIQ